MQWQFLSRIEKESLLAREGAWKLSLNEQVQSVKRLGDHGLCSFDYAAGKFRHLPSLAPAILEAVSQDKGAPDYVREEAESYLEHQAISKEFWGEKKEDDYEQVEGTLRSLCKAIVGLDDNDLKRAQEIAKDSGGSTVALAQAFATVMKEKESSGV